jgi:hypothetical protein
MTITIEKTYKYKDKTIVKANNGVSYFIFIIGENKTFGSVADAKNYINGKPTTWVVQDMWADLAQAVANLPILARCKKATYTWDGDGEQHSPEKFKVGNVYAFEVEDGTYWLNRSKSPNAMDFADERGFVHADCVGLPKEYFDEMFIIL